MTLFFDIKEILHYLIQKKKALAQMVLRSPTKKGGGYGYGFRTHRVCVCYLLMKKDVHIISSTGITDKNISEKFVIVILVIETGDFHISSKHI